MCSMIAKDSHDNVQMHDLRSARFDLVRSKHGNRPLSLARSTLQRLWIVPWRAYLVSLFYLYGGSTTLHGVRGEAATESLQDVLQTARQLCGPCGSSYLLNWN